MFVSQPEIPVPLVVEFPFPAWATRPDERADPDRWARPVRGPLVKLLHTSDWHVGKILKGVPRLDEQRAVLAEIVDLAARRRSTSSSWPATSTSRPWRRPRPRPWSGRRLLDLRATGAEVVVIAGNHDNAAQFEALRPLAAAAGITVLGRVRRPDEGGVVELTTRAGERAKVAALPFLSQRYVVRAAQLMAGDAAEHAGSYAERCRLLLDGLCADFGADTVNIVVAHAMVRGGRLGGGERDAQTIEDYYVDPTAFPATAHYVALGHLHRTQPLPGAAPDLVLGLADPGRLRRRRRRQARPPRGGLSRAAWPRSREVRLDHVRRLRTVEGTLAELRAHARRRRRPPAGGGQRAGPSRPGRRRARRSCRTRSTSASPPLSPPTSPLRPGQG